MTQDDAYITHLDENRWCAIRHLSGNGVEVHYNQFCIFPKSVKLVTDPNYDKSNKQLYFIKDLQNPVEIPDKSIDYAFITDKDRTLVNMDMVKLYANKLKEGGRLIVHQNFTGEYKFDIYVNKNNVLEVWKEKVVEGKTACIVRYGAIGDILQASSIAAGLKEQGYHVTWYCQKVGFEILQSDPNVDELILQEADLVRNTAGQAELGLFWGWLSKKYDKFVQLSESAEGSLLAIPDRTNFNWGYEARHAYMNLNYLEFQHHIAEIPYVNRVKFYPTKEEILWAREERAKMGKKIIVWCIKGSSPHKVMPYMDEYVARVMIRLPDTDVVLVGGDDALPLEAGWETEPRVHCRSGKWTIRQTLTFVQQHADLLVGPETGVMNAMCIEPMRKIIFLTHSTKENLTRDWKNTCSMSADPKKLTCGRCCMHRLHSTWDHIKQDPETGASECMAKMDRDVLFYQTEKTISGINRILH